MTIQRFNGPYAFLSNFYPCEIALGEFVFPTVEHAYQACKTEDKEWQKRICFTVETSAAKRLGRQVPLRADWEAVKLRVMEKLLRTKFADPFFARLLRNTEDATLIEENWWGDTFWGKCNGVGQNHLGRLLMKIRSEIV